MKDWSLEPTVKRIQRIINSPKPLIIPEPKTPEEDQRLKEFGETLAQHAAAMYITKNKPKNKHDNHPRST